MEMREVRRGRGVDTVGGSISSVGRGPPRAMAVSFFFTGDACKQEILKMGVLLLR